MLEETSKDQQIMQPRPETGMNAYEEDRLRRIERNRMYMAQLGLATASAPFRSLQGVALRCAVTATIPVVLQLRQRRCWSLAMP